MSTLARVKRVLVGNGTQSTIPAGLSSLGQGDMALVKVTNGASTILNATTAAALSKLDTVQIAVGLGGGNVRLSSPILGSTVSQYLGKAYAAPVLHTVRVGYNGNAGTGISTLVASTPYRLRIAIKDSNRINGERPTLIDLNYVTPATGVSAQTMAYAIAKQFYATDYSVNFASDKVVLAVVSDGTAAAIGATATLACVNGSVNVTASAGGHGLVAGSYVRIGGTAVSVPVYKVAAVNGTAITLETPYVGATGTVSNANSLAVTGATNFGFYIQALDQISKVANFANDPYNDYTNVLFTAGFSRADADADVLSDPATVTIDASADKGEGSWKQVAADEDSAKGYLGEASRRRFYDAKILNYVAVNGTYDKIDILSSDWHPGDLQKSMESPVQTVIYLPTGSSQVTGTNNFKAVLNAFFSSVVGFPAA